jgi:hypothetical protein
MYEITQSNDYIPGTWKGLKIEAGRSASLTCPECENLAVLIDHEIKADGSVNPSVVCPTDGCKFHEFVILKDWKRGG